MVQQTVLNRRGVIAAIGAAGSMALAGCSSGNGGSGGNYVVGTAGESTAVHGGTVGLVEEISNNSDVLNMNARTTPGTSANPRLLDSGEIDVAAGSDLNAWEGNQGIGSYADPVLDVTMCQSAPTHTVEVFLAKRDTEEYADVETVSDIPQDAPMTWGAPGSSGYFYFQYMFEMLGLENPTENYNLQNMDYGEIADSFREDRVDITIYLTLSQEILPGYIQEVESAADMVPLDWGFTEQDLMESDTPFSYAEISAEHFASDALDPIPAMASVYTTYFPEDFNEDHVYEFLEVAMDNNEAIREYHATVSNYGPEFTQNWIIQSEFVPIHPGAEQYFRDNDMWNDNWPTLDDYSDPR